MRRFFSLVQEVGGGCAAEAEGFGTDELRSPENRFAILRSRSPKSPQTINRTRLKAVSVKVSYASITSPT